MREKNDQRFTEIETKVAYLENMVDKLNQVVIKQQDQIDDLRRKFKNMVTEMNALNSVIKDNNDEPAPPHY